MATHPPGGPDPSGEQRLRDAARALAEAAGQFGQSLGSAGAQAETGVTKGLLAAAQALAQASAWVEQRAKPLSTKEKLLEQAVRLFAERGYAGVSLEDIAQAAGFTKGAVYSHFGSKEQTFLAALRAATEDLASLGVAQERPAEAGPGGADVAAGAGDVAAGAGDGGAGAAAGGAGAAGAAAGAPESADDPALQPPSRTGPQQLAQAVTLALEAMLFGRRTPERREEVRGIVADLIEALAAAKRRLGDAGDGHERVLDRDESVVADLAMRTLLLGLTSDAPAGGPSES
ncbi:helix-turn-helix domain-containing protein [Leucobacter aridicollis]|uniref:helix-turn-helix domain-containing protein n=1 Tax=Leucobacter aridicollis TaxID=283878 RepID=UPI00216A941C|nr:helix-turn-helix domain-containing protein [Leucobacter aridicollis]MCS3427658.1 AcrR family transcriptional regulator [Leucobacter aridicollis]